ncbi:MAG: hypothetical protein QOE08_750 [Thermoleophilaceae bacterium]|jgi:hypothetical protein|nr:hypothetical protein [Thermoleophilaceae bacterium]
MFPVRRNGFRAAAFAGALLLALVALAVVPWSPNQAGSATADAGALKPPPAPLFDVVVPQVRAAAHRRPRKGETPIAILRRPSALFTKPGGKRFAKLARRSEFGSPRVLAVIGRRGGWLRVLAKELPNNRSAWIPASAARLEATPWALRADVSKREVVVLKRGKVVRRFGATMGGASTPTPTGRFAVTDKILYRNAAGPYGCCALALTGHQPRLPAGWPGGDRLALHATPGARGTMSHGCLRADTADASWVVRRVLLGSVMTIRR